jgi:hypothetical protein
MATPEQCIFAFKPAENQPDGVPVLVFLMPQAGWDYMRNGLGHDFDLTNVGIPLKVLIGRCETRESGIAMLRKTGSTWTWRSATGSRGSEGADGRTER